MNTTNSLLTAVVLSAVACVASPCRAQAEDSSSDGVAIERILTEVQKGLVDAQKQVVPLGLPALTSVNLTLQTEVHRRGGAGIKLFIFSFGRKWEKERSQEVSIDLAPPPPTAPRPVSGGTLLSAQLAGAIVDAALGVRQASQHPDYPLAMKTLRVELLFVVVTETQGGLSFKILVVTPELEGNLKEKAIQKLTVIFGGKN